MRVRLFLYAATIWHSSAPAKGRLPRWSDFTAVKEKVDMNEWLQVLKAADAAAKWHVHQRRKGPAQEPYINHLLEVAMLVADATGGTDTNLVIAALLHDAIEDCEVPREMIAETFSDERRRLLNEHTNRLSREQAIWFDETKRLIKEKADGIKAAPKQLFDPGQWLSAAYPSSIGR